MHVRFTDTLTVFILILIVFTVLPAGFRTVWLFQLLTCDVGSHAVHLFFCCRDASPPCKSHYRPSLVLRLLVWLSYPRAFPDFLVILVCTPIGKPSHVFIFCDLLKLLTCKVDHPAGLILVVPKAGILHLKRRAGIDTPQKFWYTFVNHLWDGLVYIRRLRNQLGKQLIFRRVDHIRLSHYYKLCSTLFSPPLCENWKWKNCFLYFVCIYYPALL